ncbi:MAG: ABC transporter permease [Verrucomicrobiota bacterium]
MKVFPILLWKEWLGLRPFAGFLMVFFVFGLVMSHAVEFIDEYPLVESVLQYAGFSTFFGFLWCLIVSVGVLVREKDGETLTYLDGLPVSRSSVYVAKWVVAFFIIIGFSILLFLETWLYDLLSRTSVSEPTPWHQVWTYWALDTFLIAFFLSVLFPLSFLRRWIFVTVGGYIWLSLFLKGAQVPYAALFDPFQLIETPQAPEDPWPIPWAHLAVLTAIAILGWICGLILFNWRAHRFGKLWRGLVDSWVGKSVGCLGILAIVIVVIGLGFLLSIVDEEPEDFHEGLAASDVRDTLVGKNEILTRQTRHHEFVYRLGDAKRVERLADQSDAAYRRVAELMQLPADQREGRIVVDLSSPLAAHNAGQAYWQKIRMRIPRKAPTEEAVAILGHELAHVFADQITDSRLSESFNETRWFHEGMASWVEYSLFRSAEAALGFERQLALASYWDEVDFSEMVNDVEASEIRDPFLVYPAGWLWVDSAEDVYGEDVVARLLRSIARKDAARKLTGLSYWREACLGADLDLERIRARFRSRLQDLEKKHVRESANYHEVTDGVALRKGAEVVIRPQWPNPGPSGWPAGAKGHCRVRSRVDDAPGQWRMAKMDEAGNFAVPAISFLRPRLQFQVGIQFPGEPVSITFGEWVEVSIAADE